MNDELYGEYAFMGIILDLVLPRICNYEIAPKHRLDFVKRSEGKE